MVLNHQPSAIWFFAFQNSDTEFLQRESGKATHSPWDYLLLCLLYLHRSLLPSPTVVSLLSDPQFLADFPNLASLAQENLDLPQLPDNLLRGKWLLFDAASLSLSSSNSDLTFGLIGGAGERS
jgi:hypothetical protein